MSIEAWVTDPAGVYIAHLERSAASPFRRFALQAGVNATGVGSLEYHLDNEIVATYDDLFAYGNLVWMRYRGKTRTWIVEERRTVLDESEHTTDWVAVSGRGAKQLIGDRTIWPTNYSDTNAKPSQWGLGGWTTKTNASAALGQNVVPVLSTTSGNGATVGDPVEIVGGGNRQIGIIASIVAGVSVTLADPLAYTFPIGSRVRSAASQWRRFVNRRSGEMLWDLINESNPRFVTQLVRGTVETTGADGWTQDFRFDNMLDVCEAVEAIYGDVELDGLTFNYRNAMGVDRTTTVILEEGADITRLEVADSDRDSISWVVAEGAGHAVFTFLAPKKKLTRAQRKTARRKAAWYKSHHRKAPPAPKRKAIIVKADYALDQADEAVAVVRRREAFLDAKDVSDPAQLDVLADAALDEHQVTEAVGLGLLETRYKVDVDYGLGDWIRAIVPSRGFDEDVRIVTVAFAEDDSELVKVAVEVNTARQDHLLKLAAGAKDTRSSLGVQNRQPQGQLVPFSFSGADVFDSTDTMDVYLFVPDRMYVTIESKALVRFREFFSAAKTAATSGTLTSASGGGATSGSSSSSSSSNGSASFGLGFDATSGTSGAASAGTAHTHSAGTYGDANAVQTDGGHSHPIPHTHSTPNHTHDIAGHTHALTYGVFKETYPGSHSVTLTVYELVDTTWTLRGTVAAMTADLNEVDLTAFITGPGNWRLQLKSDAAQPNGGRLGCDVSGYVLGAIQSA